MYFKFLIFLLFHISHSFTTTHNKLLVVSFDGFRYDYLDRHETPNLLSLIPKSTRAKVVINVFPTQTFPNHFTIATGLYVENHGVLASSVFDSKTNEIMKYGYELWHYNDDIKPIWVLNEQAGSGRYSGTMMWPGSEFKYNGTEITHIEKYNKNIPYNTRIDKVINWFKDPIKPANLVMLYFEEPDLHSHVYGPNSPEVNGMIKMVDQTAKYIVDQLEKNGLGNVNIVFLSDHGMETVTKDRVINLETWVGKDAKMYGTSPVLQIYPSTGQEENVFKILNAKAKETNLFNVYKKADIPERLHYKKCERSPPILAVAKPKYAFQDFYDSMKWYMDNFNVTENNTFGIHGYDPETVLMHPYFIGYGPKFKKNYMADHLYTVDLFLLFTHILDLELPPIKPDGSFKRIGEVFNSGSQRHPILGPAILFMILVITLGLVLSIIFVLRIRIRNLFLKNDSAAYTKLDLEENEQLFVKELESTI